MSAFSLLSCDSPAVVFCFEKGTHESQADLPLITEMRTDDFELQISCLYNRSAEITISPDLDFLGQDLILYLRFVISSCLSLSYAGITSMWHHALL